ncbi:IclR family transcriptional regulator [Streptomyces sp. b94]|nr:IclR family transcriptional regulator [Streptomyces sp. b94]
MPGAAGTVRSGRRPGPGSAPPHPHSAIAHPGLPGHDRPHEPGHDRPHEPGACHVGLRPWEVAALPPRGRRGGQPALPYLEDLYEATHESAQLAVRDDSEVVSIEWLAGRSSVGVHIRVGARRPLHATGVGLALLTHGEPEFQDAYRVGPLASFTPCTITDPVRRRRVLAGVRRTGAAVSGRQVADGALPVAAPVHGPDGTVTAAVSVVVPHAGAQVPTLVPAVRPAARGISRALERRPEEPGRDGAGRPAGR